MNLPVPTKEEAAASQENTRLKAAIGYELAIDQLNFRLAASDLPVKDLISAAEHLYKASGLAKQQEPEQAAKFSISIVMPGTNTSAAREIVIASADASPLSEIPSYVAAAPLAGNILDVDYTEVED